MYASFVIHFHTGRMDNLLQTLRFLEKNHPEVVSKSQLVTVCQNNCKPLENGFFDYKHLNMDVENMQLPKLTNTGVANCDAEKIIILESDRVLPRGYFAEVIDEMQPRHQYTTLEMDKLTAPATDEEIEAGDYKTTCDNRSPNNEFGIKNIWSGNTAIMKSDFDKVGRMDESYTGYGWGDYDMTFTTESKGIASIYKEGHKELHLWHEGQTYGSGDQKKLYIDNCLKFCRKWNQPVPQYMKEEIIKHRGAKLY